MSKHGLYVTKLILRFSTRIAIPDGGGFADGMRFFTDQEYRSRVLKEAEKQTLAAIELIKSAPDNPYGEDSEVIARALLEKVEERLATGRQAGGEE